METIGDRKKHIKFDYQKTVFFLSMLRKWFEYFDIFTVQETNYYNNAHLNH